MISSPQTPLAATSAPPVKLRRREAKKGDGVAALGFLSPSLAGFLLFTLLPIAASLALTLFEWPLVGSPHFTGLHNFVRLFTTDTVFRHILANTFYFVGGYLVGNLIVSMGLAVWLTSKVRGKSIFRVVFFLPVVTPMVANALVWRLLYNPGNGVIDSILKSIGIGGPNWLGDAHWGMPSLILMSVWAGFGYNMLVFIAGIESIPETVYEAARLDGAGPWRQFRSITLPLLSPSLFFATVMTLITSLQVFTQPYILTGGGPGSSTTTLVLYLYQHGFQGFEMGYASTIAWVLFVIIIVITVIQFRGQRRWVHYE